MRQTSEMSTKTSGPNGREARQSYKDLLVWQRGMDLVTQVYLLTARFPKEENFGLKSQVQRAAISIPSNIAEGQARGGSSAEFGRFIRIALGSLAELDTQFELALGLGTPLTMKLAMCSHQRLNCEKCYSDC